MRIISLDTMKRMAKENRYIALLHQRYMNPTYSVVHRDCGDDDGDGIGLGMMMGMGMGMEMEIVVAPALVTGTCVARSHSFTDPSNDPAATAVLSPRQSRQNAFL